MSRCLSLDLEVSVRDRRIRAFAGVRADTGESTIFPAAREGLPAGLAKLDRFAQDAEFLLGHNLIDFDLPLLKAASPSLRLLRLPAVDTLRLNPLAFPRNPYHHLVKHYQDGQLKRGRVNDPELDARLALEVFDNQQKELRGAPTDLLTAWHWLTAADGGTGFDMVFTALRRSQRPSDSEAHEAIRARLILSQKVCAGRIRTNVPTPGYNIQSLFRILPQHTVALKCAKSLELPQNGFLRGNQGWMTTPV